MMNWEIGEFDYLIISKRTLPFIIFSMLVSITCYCKIKTFGYYVLKAARIRRDAKRENDEANMIWAEGEFLDAQAKYANSQAEFALSECKLTEMETKLKEKKELSKEASSKYAQAKDKYVQTRIKYAKAIWTFNKAIKVSASKQTIDQCKFHITGCLENLEKVPIYNGRTDQEQQIRISLSQGIANNLKEEYQTALTIFSDLIRKLDKISPFYHLVCYHLVKILHTLGHYDELEKFYMLEDLLRKGWSWPVKKLLEVYIDQILGGQRQKIALYLDLKETCQ